MCMRVCEFVCVCVRVPYTGYPYYPFTTTHTRLIFEELLAGFVVYCCCITPLHHTPAFHMLHHSHPCVPYAASHPCFPYAASLTPLRSICCITHTPAFHMLTALLLPASRALSLSCFCNLHHPSCFCPFFRCARKPSHRCISVFGSSSR